MSETKLADIRILRWPDVFKGNNVELQLDWSNDRHHTIGFPDDMTPKEAIKFLRKAVEMLEHDVKYGQL